MRSFIIAPWFMIIEIMAIHIGYSQVAAVKFIVKVPEPDTSKNRNVFLAGSFNGWSSHDSLYIMNRDDETTYSLLVPLFEGKTYTYKYTRGNWNTVEIRTDDSDITNRRLYSRNGIVLYDTVSRWKSPVQPKSPSFQMQKLMAMRDSAKLELQSTLNKLLVILKHYNEAMLAPQPNERLRKKLNKQTMEQVTKLYRTIESKVWEMGTSLSPEQKQKILTAMKNSNGSKDFLGSLGKAYGEALK
jgi:hypothetical protein